MNYHVTVRYPDGIQPIIEVRTGITEETKLKSFDTIYQAVRFKNRLIEKFDAIIEEAKA